MAVLTEDWAKSIEEVLFDGSNSFITMSRSHDNFVKNKTVHVPQAGTVSGVTKNRALYPATVESRSDTTLDYNLDDYSVDPVRVGRIEDIQNSYEKMQSVMFQHTNLLKEEIALNTLFDWSTSTAANIILTTGAASGTLNGPAGSTGTTRKVLVLQDILSASKRLDEMLVPDDGRRVLVMPSNMYNELFTIQDLLRDDIADKKSLGSGIMKRVFGFNIVKRSFVLTYQADVKNAVGSAIAASDDSGCIAYHPDFVAKALGAITMYDERKSPTMYGDIVSADVLFKATRVRSDAAGVVNIVQNV